MASPVAVGTMSEGGLLVLTLDRPPANILDAEMLESLRHGVETHAGRKELKAILFTGSGDHFSYGASVQEHQKEQAPKMLAAFHGFFRRLAALGVPTLAAVRGRCLGGGAELALYCSWVFVAPDAHFGQPEIKLGVLAPMASVILPWRAGGAAALDLCVSGRVVDAEEASRLGLVNRVCDDPLAEAVAFYTAQLHPLSASSLRFAERAARRGLSLALDEALVDIERLYLDELMETRDANEGIASFLEKHPPEFSHE